MPSSSFEQFRQIVFDDGELQSELRDIVVTNEFVARVVEVGAARGFDFSAEDVVQAMNEGRRAWIERGI